MPLKDLRDFIKKETALLSKSLETYLRTGDFNPLHSNLTALHSKYQLYNLSATYHNFYEIFSSAQSASYIETREDKSWYFQRISPKNLNQLQTMQNPLPVLEEMHNDFVFLCDKLKNLQIDLIF